MLGRWMIDRAGSRNWDELTVSTFMLVHMIEIITLFRTLSFWGTMLGFFVMLSLRIAHVSLNPIWWSPTFNTVIFVVGVVMTISQSLFISSHSSTLKSKGTSTTPIEFHRWLRISIGFSSLFWLTHWVFGEVSLVSRWVGTGAPDAGPHPNPWG